MTSAFLLYSLSFLVAIIVIVFIHEYGHFKVARWCGVNVTDFSIGFGPEITSWKDSKGTKWKICWLPLGGYVKFEGDTNAASLPDGSHQAQNMTLGPGAFLSKNLWQKAAVVAAGPIANFVLAIAIFTVMLATVGEQLLAARVGKLEKGGPAETAGLLQGDYVRSVDGRAISSFLDLKIIISTGSGSPVELLVERDGKFLTKTMTPKPAEDPHPLGGTVKVVRIGIEPSREASDIVAKVYPLPEAAVRAVERTALVVTTTLKVFGRMVTGNGGQDQIGGVLSMAKGAGDAVSSGLPSFIGFIGFISISIGLINLFPIPMLDGGHLMFYAIEAIRGKPLGPVAQEWALRIGVSLVLLLMFMGNFNDIVRKFASG